ncbi:MinD/ParA family protein [Oceanidesulfovibrio indonesiensis]|uniref:MinD/ParA family protein n=1 Tax=Oceanidesulfovibrio indonesiensis TaxID=54767 RepID=A0A7M3MEN3_9BACT|nr:MinD/ParA family protein [Oceanidesulfovibrio indonesiensis]TVM16940.1 MinD/ParA family protein [Oceanidesulfovibrio indonesiensis]
MTAHVVSIASGKGGVGKTNVAVNLALALGEAGKRVCLLDADLGLSNVDILLGIEPQRTLDDVLFEGAVVEDCLLSIRPNVHLLPGSSGVARLASLDKPQRAALVEEFRKLTAFDFLLVDNSSGISAPVISLCLSSRELIVLATPEAASITDAYALIKVLKENGLWWSPLLLINRARSAKHAVAVFSRLRETALKRLNLTCLPLGWLPEDPAVGRASLMRSPVLETEPDAPFCRLVREAAKRLVSHAQRQGKGKAESPEAFLEQSITRLRSTVPPAGAASRNKGLSDLQPHAARALAGLDEAFLLLDEMRDMNGEKARKVQHALEPSHRLLAGLAGIQQNNAAGASPEGSKTKADVESQPRALVLCQDPGLRELFCDLMVEAGLAPVDGLDAPQTDKDITPALIILSLDRLPESDYMPWLMEPGRIPVLLLEGYGEASRLAEAASPAHVTLLRKPFAIADFVTSARRLAGIR